MLARCASCGVPFAVPDDRAANPGLRVRCRCGAEFALHEPKPPRVPATAGEAVAARPAPGFDPSRSSAWRRCSNHTQVKSASVCPACGVGFCRDCEQRVRNVPVCPRCQGLCSEVAQTEEDAVRARQRARTMAEDVGFIASYPFSDPVAYVMLGVFTGLFSFFSGFAMGAILSKGVLVWYGFTALTKVAVGRFRGYMPNFGDITDIVHPLRLSLAAFLAASWPLIAVWHFFGLNPLIGLEAIAKMGGANWFAAAIYFALTLAQALFDRALSLIPIAGAMLGAFVAAYVSLTTGCALGLAVFKKAKELNLD